MSLLRQTLIKKKTFIIRIHKTLKILCKALILLNHLLDLIKISFNLCFKIIHLYKYLKIKAKAKISTLNNHFLLFKINLTNLQTQILEKNSEKNLFIWREREKKKEIKINQLLFKLKLSTST
jgi:hypothetical protein